MSTKMYREESWLTMGIIKESGNVLIISDLHLPFHHKKALDHCKRIRDKYNCSVIVDIGDMFDLHAINFHEKIPDETNLSKELDDVQREVPKWIKAFPKVYHLYGNHSALLSRKAVSAGLSSRMIKSLNQLFDLPDSWLWDDVWIKDDVKYIHGQEKSGKYAYADWARDNMQSTVVGHAHTTAGVSWTASSYKLVWGMGCGCLIDHESYAMKYAKGFARKPIIGCGVVLNKGKLPIFEPLEL